MSFDYKDKQMLERMRIDLNSLVRELQRIADALERLAPPPDDEYKDMY